MINFSHPGDIFAPAYQSLLDRYGKDKDFSLDFLPSIDKRIWGLSRKELVVVAGRPSNGKSVLMLQMAHSFAKQGKSILFITLEMTKESCVYRMMNAECSIDNWSNIAGISPEDAQKQSGIISDFSEKMDNLKLCIVEGYGKSFKEIIKIIETTGQKIDAIFIDYLQMITNPNKEGIDEYIKLLRNEVAIKKDCLVVVASQINRGTYDGKKVKEPEMWELKGSGAIEEVCDKCFLVHWQYHYTNESEILNSYWIRVSKNRTGRTGIFECKYEPQYTRIGEKDAGFIAGFGKCVGTADKSYEENVF